MLRGALVTLPTLLFLPTGPSTPWGPDVFKLRIVGSLIVVRDREDDMLALVGESRNVRRNPGEVLKDHEQIVTLLQRAARDANLSNLLVDRKDAEAHKLGRDGAEGGIFVVPLNGTRG